jgi:hypothetical protein
MLYARGPETLKKRGIWNKDIEKIRAAMSCLCFIFPRKIVFATEIFLDHVKKSYNGFMYYSGG